MIKKIFLSFLLILSIGTGRVFSQDESEIETDSIKTEDIIIPVSEITTYTEEVSARFLELREQVLPSSELVHLDSILDSTLVLLNFERQLVYSDTTDLSYRALEFSLKKWQGYEKKLGKVQNTLKDRADDLQEVSDELNEYNSIWQSTKESVLEHDASKEVVESIEDVIASINTIIIETNGQSDSLFIIQKSLTELALIIDEVIHEILAREKNLQSSYFAIESAPIWGAKDSLSSNSIVLATALKALRDDKDVIQFYMKNNLQPLFLQLIVLIAFLVLLFYLRRKWLIKLAPIEDSLVVLQTKVVLSNPIASALSLGMLISAFFYKDNPPALGELFAAFIMFLAVFLLPKLTKIRLRFDLVVLLILLLISFWGNYNGAKSFPTRLANILGAITLLTVLTDLLFNKQFSSLITGNNRRILKPTLFLYIIFVVFSIAANIIGAANLADFLYSGVLYSMIFGMITILIVKVFVSVVLLLTKVDSSVPMQTLSNIRLLIQKRIVWLASWAGFFLWIYLTLVSFGVIKFFNNLINDIMDTTWGIGNISISVGGIISFLVILIITSIIAKVIKNILSEDWIETSALPKGSSGALSIILRIIVVTIGLYLAALAAGIDLSQLGFILGALSVGIGFGLQSVVLNFIAGLILAFERPIHVGDTIEVDMEYGVVSEIGIRASKVRTFAGIEVIIPNGDLVSKKVLNYTLTDEKRRFKIPFKTAMDADADKVIAILNEVATEHPNTFDNPKPKTYFWGYGDTSLDFFLYFWTEFNVGLSTRSAVVLEAHKRLKKAGIKLPIPIRKMRIDKEDDDEIIRQSS